MLNKKAQGMSTNTIILLILGLILLVALIAGFSTGWKAFKNVTNPTNVDAVRDDCSSACSIKQEFDFCSTDRILRITQEDFEVRTSCEVLSSLSKDPEFARFKVNECSSFACDLPCESIRINEKNARISDTVLETEYDLTSVANDLNEGQFCVADRN